MFISYKFKYKIIEKRQPTTSELSGSSLFLKRNNL